jgi:formylglycine-generating enzyme required for sulfatase activity
MISELIEILDGIGIEFSAEEIADVLWLARYMDEPEAEKETKPKPKIPDSRVPKPDAEADSSISKPDVEDAEAVNRRKETDKHKDKDALSDRANLYPSDSAKEEQFGIGTGGLSIRIPAGEALPGKLDIGRSLRPLMRRMPSRSRMILDEEATVRRIADQDNWMPVMRPEPSRWLDIVLIVDESPSMVLWQETVAELKELLERQGAFRDVQLWGFSFDKNSEECRLHVGIGFHASRNMPRDPGELTDPSGRRMLLILSDCVSPPWHDGRIRDMLKIWEDNSRIAIVQMLPHRFWERSGLGKAEPVYLRSLSPDTPNSKLEIESSPEWFEEKLPEGPKTPVITLEPRSLLPWAKSVAGLGGLWVPGFVFPDSPVSDDDDEDEDDEKQSPDSPPSPEKLISIFRSLASPQARKLAGYFAAVPLTLLIMRLIQRVMLSESRQVHLAEVFLSGLIKRQSPDDPDIEPNEIHYDFVKGVRELLNSGTLISETVNVISLVSKELSAFIDKHTGEAFDFRAMLENPAMAEWISFEGKSGAFASIAADVLRRLGGRYALLAEGLKPYQPKRFTNSIGMEFVWIPPGEFMMGSPEDEPGRYKRETLHRVKLTRGFYMQTTQVTRGQWKALIKNNPSYFKDGGDDCPVETVSWDDAQEFIEKLNLDSARLTAVGEPSRTYRLPAEPVEAVSWDDAQEFIEKLNLDSARLTAVGEPSRTYRLPTEAEWEYACRAGTTTPFYFGKCLSADEANYDGNYPLEGCPKGEYRKKTTPVKIFPSNAWGLYDMHGNVWELCQDWYGDYASGSVTDPIGPSSGSDRVLRGGCWISSAQHCRSAYRGRLSPGLRNYDLGFRLVLPAGQQG